MSWKLQFMANRFCMAPTLTVTRKLWPVEAGGGFVQTAAIALEKQLQHFLRKMLPTKKRLTPQKIMCTSLKVAPENSGIYSANRLPPLIKMLGPVILFFPSQFYTSSLCIRTWLREGSQNYSGFLTLRFKHVFISRKRELIIWYFSFMVMLLRISPFFGPAVASKSASSTFFSCNFSF
jgi:hypothetical protein